MTRGKTRRAVAATMAVLGLGLGGLSACSSGNGPQYKFKGLTKLGQTIPAPQRKLAGQASAPYLAGQQTWKLSSLKGDVVVLNLWASWCQPCLAESPRLQKIYEAYQGQGVDFVGVDTKDLNRGAAQSFVKDAGITYPSVYDPLAKVAIELGRVPVQALPSTVLIDKQGRIAAVYGQAVAAGDLDPALSSLVAEK